MKKKFMCLLLSCVIAFSCVANAAAFTQNSYHMPHGACWKWDGKFDLNVTGSWSSSTYANAQLFQEVQYLTPAQVKIMYDDIYSEMAQSDISAAYPVIVNMIITYGVKKAKTMITQKLGANVESKFIPFLNSISWTVTILQTLSDIGSGLQANFIKNLYQANQGLIIGTGRQNAGALYLKTAWTGKWGTYPYGKSPNNYQFGSWTIY